jgi:hypothetical protein
MTIMERGGAWFWRPKPSGGGRKASGAKKADKSAKKTPIPVKKVIRRKPAASEPSSDDE